MSCETGDRTDRGLDALVPNLDDGLLSPADFVYWEALYTDGSVLRETDGKSYSAIDRSRLVSFQLIHGGETLLEMFPPPGATGRNLVYRRRTQMGTYGRRVLVIVGWAPMGPVVVVDPAGAAYSEAPGFDPSIPELSPPQPMPGEPKEMLLSDERLGAADAVR